MAEPGIVVECRTCGGEVVSTQRRDGQCPTCWLKVLLEPELEEYARLWSKRVRYAKAGASISSIEKQGTRHVLRMSRRIASVLGMGKGGELLNEELARVRDEVERKSAGRIVAARSQVLVPAATGRELIAAR